MLALPAAVALVLAASMIDRPAMAQTPILNEEQKLIASDGDDNDELGVSVAASGDVIAIGASSDDHNGLFSGSAYVFRWNGAQWVEEQKLLASDGVASDLFGFSLDATSDVIVVGSRLDDDNGADSGSAYVYRWNGAQWIEEQKLLASDGAQNDHFGESVAVSGDVIVVGALTDSDNGLHSGSAYVYRWDGAQWVEEQKLLASDGAAGELFGRSVDVSGDVIAIGAPFDDDNGFRSGSAYVYRWNGVWVEEQKLLAFDGPDRIQFGWSIAASGDVIVAGSPNDQNDNGADSGSAYVFRWNGAQWVEEQKLLASDSLPFDEFHVVDTSGDLIVVGAGGDDNENGNGAGSGYIYRWNGAQWIEEWKLLASDGATADRLGGQQFTNGRAVAISGDVIVVGATGADDDGFFGSGAAYVFIPESVAETDGTAPLVTDVGATPNPVSIGTPIELTATVDDNEMGGSIIAFAAYSIDGAAAVLMEAVDGGFDEVTEDVGAVLPAFTTTGVHEVCVAVVDAAGNASAAECIALAVFDPAAGFVTGGGWIDSPAGAYPAEPDAVGNASFGFVSKYHEGALTPDGQTQFRLRQAGLTFHSEAYDTLVVSGAEARYGGSGRVNGNSGYGFLVAVIDGDLAGDGIDRFRLKIWQTASGTVIYDSQPGDADTAPATTPLGGGNIAIHTQ